MTPLFLGTPEIMMLLFSLVIPLGMAALFLYALYRIVDRWVDKMVNVRREQNVLLAKLIDNMEGEKAAGGSAE